MMMAASGTDTLLVKNLSNFLSGDEKHEFFKYFGATEINVFDSKYKKKSSAFVRFSSPEVATTVLSRLHQKELFGNRLVVEYAESNQSCYKNTNFEDTSDEKLKSRKENDQHEDFLAKLNNWTKGLNLNLPPPHHLKYKYPKATAEVLLHITNMLSSVPKFYTQVLHLMNRMNLPCPFQTEYPLKENEIFDSFVRYIFDKYDTHNKLVQESSSSEIESELESEQETANNDTNVVLPQKRKNPRDKKLLIKKQKFKIHPTPSSALHSTPLMSKTDIKDVFESIDRDLNPKKIEVKIPEMITVKEIEPKLETRTDGEGFGVKYPLEKEKFDVSDNQQEDELLLKQDEFITKEKLAANRISERDMKQLPVFKNYQSGPPSCRLYVKNLSKNVTRADLLYIYNKYFIKGIDEQGTMFDLRLMQEGRMKGQAFVTLQNIKQAELALKETNGYILKDKPMVVQYARSAPAK